MVLQDLSTGVVVLEHKMQDPVVLELNTVGLHGIAKTTHAGEKVKDQMLD